MALVLTARGMRGWGYDDALLYYQKKFHDMLLDYEAIGDGTVVTFDVGQTRFSAIASTIRPVVP